MQTHALTRLLTNLILAHHTINEAISMYQLVTQKTILHPLNT